jgi:hypothetical protein
VTWMGKVQVYPGRNIGQTCSFSIVCAPKLMALSLLRDRQSGGTAVHVAAQSSLRSDILVDCRRRGSLVDAAVAARRVGVCERPAGCSFCVLAASLFARCGTVPAVAAVTLHCIQRVCLRPA